MPRPTKNIKKKRQYKKFSPQSVVPEKQKMEVLEIKHRNKIMGKVVTGSFGDKERLFLPHPDQLDPNDTSHMVRKNDPLNKIIESTGIGKFLRKGAKKTYKEIYKNPVKFLFG